MSKRIFYVISLDRNRMMLIAVSVLAAMLGSYAYGHYSASQSKPAQMTLGSQIPTNSLENPDYSKEDNTPKNDMGQSVFEQNSSFGQMEQRPINEDLNEPKTQSVEYDDKPVSLKKRENTPKKTTKKKAAKAKKATQSDKKSPPKIAKKQPERAKKTSTLLQQDQNGIKLSNVSNKPPDHQLPKKAVVKVVEPVTHIYSLQTGSFKSREAAQRMAKILTNQGFPARTTAKKGQYYVRVGKENDEKKLWKIESRLRKQKYSPIKVKIAVSG